MKVGFVDLGIMGLPTALNLATAGHSLVVYDKRAVSEYVRAAGVIVKKTLADVALQDDVIIVMVPDTQDVEQALFAEDSLTSRR